MPRDMDLIRRIALTASDLPYGKTLDDLDGVAAEDFAQHVMWMREAGLVLAHADDVYEYDGDPPSAWVNRLTWEGCEFVDAIRSDTLWKKAKETVIKPGASFTFSVLRDWLKTEIAQGLPTIRTVGQ